MTVADLLPWLNLLMLPALGLLSRISGQLATLEAVQREHERRLNALDAQRLNTFHHPPERATP